MVITGSTLDSTRAGIELARAAPDRFRATAGVHPHHAHEFHEVDLPALRELLRAPEVGAAGECGLDYFRNFSPHADQERAFRQQLELAIECGKPLFLHQRDAHDDLLAILKPYLPKCGPAVVHCFTGDERALRESLDAGCYIGITGWLCDERRGQHLRELVKRIPADRLMVETDGPYLLPRSLKPAPKDRRNEPAFLPHIVHELARDRGEDVAVTAASTTATARGFFRLPAD